MPYVTLKFKLPEEDEEFKCSKNGSTYLAALQEVEAKLREIVKYSSSKKAVQTAEWARKLFWEILDRYNISIWS